VRVCSRSGLFVEHPDCQIEKKDIGDSMGVSDARIGQIHNEAINILRKVSSGHI
jgi:hypothetical protein